MITPYVWWLLQGIAFIKILNVIVLVRNRQLEPQDVYDFRPFGREHTKLLEIAQSMVPWKRAVLRIQVYLHRAMLIALLLVMMVMVIWIWYRRYWLA